MTTSERYTIDGERVVSETIDGETIIINLANGNYYSLNHVGAEIWSCIQSAMTFAEIVTAVGDRFECASDPAPSIRRFVDELAADDLIAMDGAAAVPPQPRPAASAPGKEPFAPPTVEKFTDMQGFLLVDPIHEVDDAGWPHKAKE